MGGFQLGQQRGYSGVFFLETGQIFLLLFAAEAVPFRYYPGRSLLEIFNSLHQMDFSFLFIGNLVVLFL